MGWAAAVPGAVTGGVQGLPQVDLSHLGFAIQMAGMICLALLFRLLDGAVRRPYFGIWGRGFLGLALALVALKGAFHLPWLRSPLETAYYVGEYAFAHHLWAGFSAYGEREDVPRPLTPLGLGGMVLLGGALSLVPGPFAMRFAVHAVVFAGALGASLPRVLAMPIPGGARWVRAFAALALLGLALDFAFQGVFSLWLALRGHGTVTAYSAYHSILDLGSEVLLAFSLVSLATVDVRRSLEAANQIMQGERDRLAMLAHTDALTECFNRRALDELMGRVGQRTGLVAVLDLNKLKPINDTLGHAAGDSAIRFTAQALKGLLRTHDHLFRTGGDEFVLVAFNLPPTEAERRFEKLGRTLAGYHREDGNPHPLSISFGLAEFGLARPLESSLAQADAAMYAQKQARGMAR